MIGQKNSWKNLAGRKVLGLFSGGLDSQTTVSWLKSLGIKVISATVDLAQPDEDDVSDIPVKMKKAGAEEAILVDGRKLMAEYMLLGIQGQCKYEGGYLNTTGIARMATIKSILRVIEERKIDVVIHGATGRGNDQVRFELALAMLAPHVQVYAPWRDPDFLERFGGRKEMIEYCKAQGLDIVATEEKPYSTDANFGGLTHEAGKLEQLDTPTDFVQFKMGVSPQEAIDREEDVVIAFEKGRPVSVDHANYSLLGVFLQLNMIAGTFGIGTGIDQVENRRVGIKSRGVYESPGATLLAAAYVKMLELVLDRGSRKFFDFVSMEFAEVIYHGELFGSKAGLLLPVIQKVAGKVTGSVTFKLYKGNIRFVKAEGVEHSLYDIENASMENVGAYNHTSAQGYMEIVDVSARALAAAKQVERLDHLNP